MARRKVKLAGHLCPECGGSIPDGECDCPRPEESIPAPEVCERCGQKPEKGKCDCARTAQEFSDLVRELPYPPRGIPDLDRHAAITAYHQRAYAIQKRFRAKLERENGVAKDGQKLRDLLWDMAWDDGHSDGYTQVEYHYERFTDLVDAVKKGE